MNLTSISTFNQAFHIVSFLSLGNLVFQLNLAISNCFNMVSYKLIQIHIRLSVAACVVQGQVDQVVLVTHLKLVFKAISPVAVFHQMSKSALFAALKEVFSELQALDLMHGLNLLVALGAGLL